MIDPLGPWPDIVEHLRIAIPDIFRPYLYAWFGFQNFCDFTDNPVGAIQTAALLRFHRNPEIGRVSKGKKRKAQ